MFVFLLHDNSIFEFSKIGRLEMRFRGFGLWGCGGFI